MTTLANALSKAKKPARIVVVPTSAFADSWGSRPKMEVAAGIRLLSEAQIHNARAEAARVAVEAFSTKDGEPTDLEARNDAYNDTLVRAGIAASLCDPNDVSVPFFEFAEHVVRVALTSEGARWLWDQITLAHIELGPATRQASDEDVAEVARRLAGGSLGRLPMLEQIASRKVLAHLLERLSTVEEAPTPLLGETEDEDKDVFADQAVHVIVASAAGQG